MKDLDKFMEWLEENGLITINDCSGRDTWRDDYEQFVKELESKNGEE
jgi:hypothetical protein